MPFFSKTHIIRAFTALLGFTIVSCQQFETPESLIPDKASEAPDYFCTWNLQGYLVSYISNEEQRKAMCEENLFGNGEYQAWAELYPEIRQDLFFVMDDSWDIPLNENMANDNKYLGWSYLDTSRFPSYTGDIGVFGFFKSMTLSLLEPIDIKEYKVFAQDLLSDYPIDISEEIIVNERNIEIPGSLIESIGLMGSSTGDLSPPGIVIRFVKKSKR